ncbi:MAG TPA: undecaprenyl-phosphate galactose phosphotransferase WbaP [Anaerolineales bacterium]|nr:undecaprenyl-phosphate galactose phosphotransferase WbaP [Anaerolineales bacterium]
MKTELIYQNQDFYSRSAQSLTIRCRRFVMSAFLLSSDSLAITTSILISLALWKQVRADLQVEAHLSMIVPAFIFFAFIYHLMALYPAVGIGPVEELKRLTISTSFVMSALITASFFLRVTTTFSRATLIIAWLLIMISSPLFRKIFRRIAVRLNFWGIPTMIVGDKKGVIRFQDYLSRHPLSGFWPVLCMAGAIQDIFPRNNGDAQLFSHVQTLIIAEGQGKFDSVRHLITQRKYRFKHIIVLFNEANISPIWFTPITLVENMGLEVVHNLLNSTQKFSKRVMEMVIMFLSMPFLVVLFAVVALLIKINSPGPVFYQHKRIGLDGKEIWIWKFRTMTHNSEFALQEHLKEDAALQMEWKSNFKLREDPRVNTIGRFLRRTSLDELPQIWNVLKGEMSLIGPRPIVTEEIALYGDEFEIYKQVLPGITGLWQISGRNDLPYHDRVKLDVYYIQNWSIWLDIHILMHTLLATLQARGAY